MYPPGVGGYGGDGDITSANNLMAFQDYVLEQTEGKGVHFVMADGVSLSSLRNNHCWHCCTSVI